MLEKTHKKYYTVGFIFNTTLEKVLLIKKNRPAWQQGKINGIGGKIEEGEKATEGITRETREETGLDIPHEKWTPVCEIYDGINDPRKKRNCIYVFSTVYSGNMHDAQQTTDEEIMWESVADLPETVIENLDWLIPMSISCCKQKTRGYACISTERISTQHK